MRMRFMVILALVLLVIISSSMCLHAQLKYKTSGIYVDGSGTQQTWMINDSHTLMWQGEPYMPFGLYYIPETLEVSLMPDISQEIFNEAYKKDVEYIESLKQKGINNIIIKTPTGLTNTLPQLFQKIIDLLDSEGITYGVEIGGGPEKPLSGYLINPGKYRLQGPTFESVITREWPNVTSALFVIMDMREKTVLGKGGAVVKDGKVTINMGRRLGKDNLLLVYPRIAYKKASDGGIGDIWGDFSQYRDSLLDCLKKIKFGKGLRFFVDPFNAELDLTGDMSGFIPDSEGFRLGFEAYLTKKRVHEGAVGSSWGLNTNVESIADAARLVPLWSKGRGIPYAYDFGSAQLFDIDSTASKIWMDLNDFRDQSLQEYMVNISEVVKKNSATVPVLFKVSSYYRAYRNPFGIGGYDGLIADTKGRGEEVVEKYAGAIFSLAEESSKTMILYALAKPADILLSEKTTYQDQSSMFASIDSLRDSGYKGFYVYSNSSDNSYLDWVKEVSDKVGKSTRQDYKPHVIDFPDSITSGAYVKRLMPGIWWFPSMKSGKTNYIGDGLSMYAIPVEDMCAIWSTNGKQNLTFKTAKNSTPRIEFPSEYNISKKKDGTFTLTVSEVPTILKGLDVRDAFPYETAEDEINKLNLIIPQADKLKYDVKQARMAIGRARSVLKNGLSTTSYSIAKESLGQLITLMGSNDIWIEGESSVTNNFDGVESINGANGVGVLLVDTFSEPLMSSYESEYNFDVASNASYEIWIAATLPDESSKVSYIMDDTNYIPITPEAESISKYAKNLAWYKLGSMNLYPGKHVIKFRVESKRPIDNKYFFAIDAIFMTQRGVKPNGVIKP